MALILDLLGTKNLIETLRLIKSKMKSRSECICQIKFIFNVPGCRTLDLEILESKLTFESKVNLNLNFNLNLDFSEA